MLVFEIVTPGTRLDYADRAWSWNVQNQLQLLESQFFEANAALNLFIDTQAIRPSFARQDTWERDSQRRAELQRQVEAERGGLGSHEHRDEMRFEVELRLKRDKWANGGLPREFEHNLPFIYARAFLYALDVFDKVLGVLAQQSGVATDLAEFHEQVALDFPNLRGVRNTMQHLEDRARGLGAGRPPQPLDLKPIASKVISAPSGGALGLNCLNGTKYSCTMSDGHLGEVDVSPESMRRLQSILEGVLKAFKWRGPKQHAPGT